MNRRELLQVGSGIALSAAWAFPKPALAQSRTIEVWSHTPAGDGNVVERAVAHAANSFMAKVPGVTVRVVSMPWQQISPTLLRSVKAGKAPDIAMLFSPQMPVQIEAGTLTPLNGFMERWPEQARGDIVRLPQAESKGVVFGLPWQARTSGLVYRADLLEAGGRQPPRSLPEWSQTAAALAKGDVIGTALGFSPEGASIAAAWFLTTQVGMGAEVLKPDGQANFMTPEAEQIVQWVVEQVRMKPPTLPADVAMLDQEKEHDLFSARRAVFLPTSSDRHPRVVEKSGLPAKSIGMVRYPTFDPAKPAPAVVQSWNLVIPRGAAQAELSWQFIEHWTSPEVQVQGAKIAGLGPVRRSALKDPFFEQPEAQILRWATEYPAEHPLKFVFPTNTEVLYDTWAKMFGQAVSGSMSPRDALAWAEKEYTRRVRQ